MSDERIIMEKTRIKYISPAPDPVTKAKGWNVGYITITDKRICFTSEDKNEETSINISDVSEIDPKMNLGKMVLGAARILPICYKDKGTKAFSLISTTLEHATNLKKILLSGASSNSDIEFVCPFSKGGKILLDKQPTRGKLQIQDNKLYLESEWLGKKQCEIIDLQKIDDFEISGDSAQGSLTLKYQKDGIVISTLITAEGKIISFLNQFIKTAKGISDEQENIEIDDQQFMLLQMMYTSDLDASMALEMLGITRDQLEKIIHTLVSYNLLKVSAKDEVELTEKGTKYIVGLMKKSIEGV